MPRPLTFNLRLLLLLEKPAAEKVPRVAASNSNYWTLSKSL